MTTKICFGIFFTVLVDISELASELLSEMLYADKLDSTRTRFVWVIYRICGELICHKLSLKAKRNCLQDLCTANNSV